MKTKILSSIFSTLGMAAIQVTAYAGTSAFIPQTSALSVQGGHYDLGVLFTANENLTVDALGIYDTPGFTGGETVTMYDSGGNVLSSAFVTDAGALVDGYFWQAIAPLALIAGQQYTVSAFYATNPDSYLYGSPLPAFDPGITFNGTRYEVGSLQWPTLVDGGQPFYYGPNFSIVASTVPDAGRSSILMGLAVLGLFALRSKLPV